MQTWQSCAGEHGEERSKAASRTKSDPARGVTRSGLVCFLFTKDSSVTGSFTTGRQARQAASRG